MLPPILELVVKDLKVGKAPRVHPALNLPLVLRRGVGLLLRLLLGNRPAPLLQPTFPLAFILTVG